MSNAITNEDVQTQYLLQHSQNLRSGQIEKYPQYDRVVQSRSG